MPGVRGGDGPPAGPPPLRLRQVATPSRGGLRTVPPSVTLARLEHHVSPISGVVGTLERSAGPDELHVYVAGTGVPRVHGDDRGWERIGDRAAGKGTSDASARAGALCEALERYSGRFAHDRPRRRAAAADLGELAVRPGELLGFSAAQYRDRDTWNARARSYRTYVPEPYDDRDPVDWTPVWSLTGDRERLVPTSYCYYAADALGGQYCIGDSNGNAAGNTLEEAVLHGMLELIERDHAALWWYNRLGGAGDALDTVHDAWLARLRRRLHERGQGRCGHST